MATPRFKPASLAFAASLSLPLLAAQAGASSLPPYKMVRSLQLVQDLIADGDHAVLPMQRKILELIDRRLRASTATDFEDDRNFRALLVYAMSGGNPATVGSLLDKLTLEEIERTAGIGVVSYLNGLVFEAREAMSGFDPEQFPHEVAAFLYLVKGSVVGAENAGEAIGLLDKARLLSPGTLVEEAALRRTLSLAVSESQPERFFPASSQYARRFLRSPYAGQFADTFVSGVAEMATSANLPQITETVSWMTREQAKTIYLRIARQAAIDGKSELLAFAAAKANEYDGADTAPDPRSDLYAGISSVTSESVDEVLESLTKLDPATLSARDRELLKAAKGIAKDVLAPPLEQTNAKPSPSPARIADAPGGNETAEDLENELGIDRDIVASTRSKLEAIDKLLTETER
ncbi:hypothetical protein [Aquamicrobium sp. LC103]|uniref:hypothetical protein n=1 Tax=Aquamicrobium sp. LC103 TaxID=1120658 RepID=UPI00063E7C6F|nr:hypothetical protein [Aquamicrobium sp. LC103]TKT77494.1 chemotaxis protein [Aquamicrobium sp. LC103]